MAASGNPRRRHQVPELWELLAGVEVKRDAGKRCKTARAKRRFATGKAAAGETCRRSFIAPSEH